MTIGRCNRTELATNYSPPGAGQRDPPTLSRTPCSGNRTTQTESGKRGRMPTTQIQASNRTTETQINQSWRSEMTDLLTNSVPLSDASSPLPHVQMKRVRGNGDGAGYSDDGFCPIRNIFYMIWNAPRIAKAAATQSESSSAKREWLISALQTCMADQPG